MTRTRRRTASAALVAALAVSVAACGDDEKPSNGEPGSTSGSSPSGDAATDSPSASTSESTAAPSVTPAAGIELTEATSALNAPEGWEPDDGILDYASAARGPGDYDGLLLSDHENLAGPDATYESQAQAWFEVPPEGAKAERLPDVDLAGTPAFCIFYTVKGQAAVNYEFGTIRNGQSVTVSIALDKKTLEQDPQIVESVLASFRWVG